MFFTNCQINFLENSELHGYLEKLPHSSKGILREEPEKKFKNVKELSIFYKLLTINYIVRMLCHYLT